MNDIILVNENDIPIGTTEKLAAHEKALLHRAFSAFIFRRNADDIELLLQQRAHDKYHCSGLWTNTCCSHPAPGEETIAAGERRLQEELGFTTKLTDVGHFIYRADFDNGLVEHELDHVLIGWYHGEVINVNSDEVADVKWLSLQAVEDEAHSFTPWFRQAFEIALESL